MSEAARTRMWTRVEYDRLVEHGIFAAGERIALDRGEKAGLCARARVFEYWIVDLMGRAREVYRNPGPTHGRPLAGATASSSPSGPARRSPRSRRRRLSSPSATSFPD